MSIETTFTPALHAPAAHPDRHVSPQEKARLRRAAILTRIGGRPFTAATGMSLGLTRDDLRSADVRRLGRGSFVAARVPTSLALHTGAVLLTAPADAHAASLTAAQLQGLPVPATDRIHVSVPQGSRWRHADAVVLRHGRAQAYTVDTPVGPLAMTLPADLLAEVVDRVPLVDAVVLADAVLARHAEIADEIVAGWERDPRLRRVARLADGRSESPMETRFRLLLVLAGLPTPQVQHRVLIEGVRRRFDLAYPQWMTALEYDGEHHFTSELAKHEDAVRREAVTRAGWASISVVPRGIFTDPAGTLDRVVRQLTARGARVEVSDGWRPHFPQRVREA